jgi:hypothetical protein
VQQFGGGYPRVNRYGGWSAWSGWNIFWMIRLGIALLVVSVALVASCVSALSH